jgi:hypothetical protein
VQQQVAPIRYCAITCAVVVGRTYLENVFSSMRDLEDVLFLYLEVHGCVLFWKFLLKMLKCYLIRVFEISCWKNCVDSNWNLNEAVGPKRQSL